MSFCKGFQIILTNILLLCFPLLSAQPMVTLEALYDQGAYCDLIQLDNKISNANHKNRNNLKDQLIVCKALLELERWNQLDQNLQNLSTVEWNKESKEINLQYQLLLARHAVKDNWHYADSLFISLVNKSISNRNLRQEILGEYGLYLVYRQDTEGAEKYLLMADSLSAFNSILKAKISNALAFIYLEQSKMNRSQTYFIKVKKIWEDTQWTTNPYYPLFLNDYALYFYVQGDLTKADSLLSLSEAKSENTCTTASLLGYQASARAQISFGLGDYEKAINLYQVAFEFFDQAENHRDAVISLSHLGEACYFLGQIEAAQKHYSDAINLLDSFHPNPINPLRAQILLGLAGIEEYKYHDESADSLYISALEIMREATGEINTAYGTALSNYARFKEGTGDISAAISLYHQTEMLDSLLLGTNHPDYKTTLYNLARSYSKIDSVNKAVVYYRKANYLQLKLLNNYFENFDALTRLSYRLEAMGNFDVFFSYACNTRNQEFHAEIEDINLATKNLALDYARAQQNNLSVKSPDNRTLYNEWIESRKLLTRLYFSGVDERKDLGLSVDSLEERVNDLEKILARKIDFSVDEIQMVNCQQIIAKLAKNEAAIDFFNFYVTDEYGRLPDSILYYASIMTAEQTSPQLVYLCSQRILDEILTTSSHYTSNVEVNNLLYKTIWAPLEEFLQGVQKIHLSPEGLLHQVSFAALLPEENVSETLLDRFDFFYYSNLRDFVQKGKDHQNISSIYLVGNPDFGKYIKSPNYSSVYFYDLPETGREISNIISIFEHTNIQVEKIVGPDAIESTFYASLHRFKPNILHLATHGFFFQKDTTILEPHTLGEHIRSSEMPLLRSGFVLSGVNSIWNSDSLVDSSEDGIVTALEIADLDLSETELVVLSACETGRGSIADGEGIFGLQRALKKAGSNQLLISLWDVPDAATTALMTNFYQLIFSGMTSHNALLQAQKTIKEQYPNPFDWAAFVLFQ